MTERANNLYANRSGETLEALINRLAGFSIERPHLNRRYFAEGEGGDGTGGGAAGGDDGAETATYNPKTHAVYERRNLQGVVPDGDVNKAVALAKQAKELEADGWDAFVRSYRASGWTGHKLADELQKIADEAAQAGDTETAEAAEAAAKKAEAEAKPGGEKKPRTIEEVEADFDKKIAALTEKYEKALAETGQKVKTELMTERQIAEATKAEASALDAAVASYNLPDNRQKVTLDDGTVQEVDEDKWAAEMLTRAKAHEIHLSRIDSRRMTQEQYDAKAKEPWSPEVIQLAQQKVAASLKRYIGQAGTEGDGQETDPTKKKPVIPNASLKGGQGGRAQKNPADMTQDEKRAAAKAAVEKKLGRKVAG